MKRIDSFGRVCALLATVCLAVPKPLLATIPNRGSYPVFASASDVALGEQSLLQGVVLDEANRPVALAPVAISQNGRIVTATKTDHQGRFAVAGLRGGVYQIEAPYRTAVVRLWAPRTAPPGAVDRLVVVAAAGDTVRAQGGASLLQFLTNPWVLGGVVAAAIAIPLALDDDDKDAS